MFHALLTTLVRQQSLPSECLHEQGIDLEAGPFTLHIRERDHLVTLFIPLGDITTPSLAVMADWPVLHLSRDSSQSTLLWSREWLDKLDVESLANLVSRMLHQAGERVQAPPTKASFASSTCLPQQSDDFPHIAIRG